MMKKISALLLSCMVLLMTAGCGSGGNAPAATVPASSSASSENAASVTNRLEQIKAAGKLVICTSPDYAPYEFQDLTKSGQDAIVGADIELARHIADQLGVTLEIKAMGFDACLGAIGEGKVDLMIAGMVPKEERKVSMELSNVYYNDGDQCILIMKDRADEIKSLADFAGKRVAAQNGTLQYDLVTAQLPDTECQVVTQVTDAIMMLKTGKVDGVAVAQVPADNYIANYPELVICDQRFEYTSLGVVVASVKGEQELLDAINGIIDEVVESKTYFTWIDEANALSNSLTA